ncbi:MAG: MFS transporter [Proteobacteria bacterium]|nr:MFS transporter [Pseudomonadota bacterium]
MTIVSDTPSPKPRAAGMGFIMLAVLIDMISIGLIIPVLAPLVTSFAHSPREQTAAMLAVSLAFGAANFVGSPILGALSDRYGRRRIMLVGFSGLALSFFVTSVATALWQLVLVRIFSGAMQANVAVANAYVADITAPQDRAKRFGMLGAAFGMGFILGPVLGGLLGDPQTQLPFGLRGDLHVPFVVAGTLAVLNWLYGYFVLPESLPPARRSTHMDWRKASPLSVFARLAQLRGVGSLVWVVALSGLAQLILQSSWVLYTQHKFGWTPRDNGWALFAVGVLAVVVQGGLLRPLLKVFSVPQLAMAGLASAVVSNLLWGAATAGWVMYVAIGVGLLAYAAGPALQSHISNAADARRQGETMGALSSLNSLMAVMAPLLGMGLMYLVADLPRDDWRVGAPFYLCALLQAASLAACWVHFKHEAQAPAHIAPDAAVSPAAPPTQP